MSELMTPAEMLSAFDVASGLGQKERCAEIARDFLVMYGASLASSSQEAARLRRAIQLIQHEAGTHTVPAEHPEDSGFGRIWRMATNALKEGAPNER